MNVIYLDTSRAAQMLWPVIISVFLFFFIRRGLNFYVQLFHYKTHKINETNRTHLLRRVATDFMKQYDVNKQP